MAHPQDSLDVLRNAIDMELEGKDFFERAAKTMKHPRAREMFSSLVRQEQKHIEVIEEEMRRLESGKGWGTLSDVRSTAPRMPQISVFRDREVARRKIKDGASELEVLEVGMTVERKSVEYYRSAALKATDPGARELFDWLVGQEAGHLTILTAEHDSRSGSGFYYGEAEFSLETQ
ncbi:MAG: ferritin family protein [Thermoplasmata archaeon]|nr:ferritin family protein [Thermoplasmata archaeon]